MEPSDDDLTAEVLAAAFKASARSRRNGTPARAWVARRLEPRVTLKDGRVL